MKHFTFFLKTLLIISGLVTFVPTTSAEVKGDKYELIGVSFENTHISTADYIFEDFPNVSSMGLNGFGLEYIRGYQFTKLPMFIEAGGKFTFTFNNKKEEYRSGNEYKYSTFMCRLIIPVSYAYCFSFRDDMKITPYAGFDFKFNLAGKTKETHDYYVKKGSSYLDIYHKIEEDSYNWFNKEEVEELNGADNSRWNVFQLGWHIGGRFQYKRYFAGLTYGTDINSLFHYKKNVLGSGIYVNNHWFTGNFSLTLGYTL